MREIIDTHELRAKKSLGQNFLLDLNVTDKIARQAVDIEKMSVFEIGPGPGGLTRSLLMAGAKKVTAVEFDPRAVTALQSLKEASKGRLEIVQADALQTNLKTLCAEEPAIIVANLPYNIATPLLIGWLEQIRENQNAYSQMILMFQKEVADRIVAQPKSKAYGRLSVMSQWLCHCAPLFDLPPSVFSPPPKITSTVVQLIPKNLGMDSQPSFKDMEQVVKAAFSQRRKMIRSTLKSYLQACEKNDIDITMRAEDLTIEQFMQIAKEDR
ncbi:MAG: 16S rRNA (adenine(1518)-N(6)/adenine(1519)-N(6))-dimethyltransferase RsmA [Bdellovibrionales bacterium]